MSKEKKRASPSAHEEVGWQYKSESGDTPYSGETAMHRESVPRAKTSVEWTASEYVAHEKGVAWYLVLGLGAVLVATVLYFITKDIFSGVVILVMAAIFGVAGSHKPRVIEYKLDNAGLTAGKKFYPYSAYKSFSMPEDGPFVSVTLIPLKRLDFPVGAYLAPDNQKQALDLLSTHLPLERGELDSVERLMRALRF